MADRRIEILQNPTNSIPDGRDARGRGGQAGRIRAWIINYIARLDDGVMAQNHRQTLWRKSTLPNLSDNHPPVHIDGNLGGAAGIEEMLFQSHAGAIHRLRPLPKAWPDDKIAGLLASGGFEVKRKWRQRKQAFAMIHPLNGKRCGGGPTCTVDIDKGETKRVF